MTIYDELEAIRRSIRDLVKGLKLPTRDTELMLALHRVLRRVTPKPCYAHLLQRDLATGAGLIGELTSRGFISQVTK